MRHKSSPHYFKSMERNTLVSVDDVAEAIQRLAQKDEVELFELATSGGLDDVFPFNVVTTGDDESSLGRWSAQIEGENMEENLEAWAQALADYNAGQDNLIEEESSPEQHDDTFLHSTTDQIPNAQHLLRYLNAEMRAASPWFRQLLVESKSRDPAEALHDVRLLERFLELQNELPLDLKELLK